MIGKNPASISGVEVLINFLKEYKDNKWNIRGYHTRMENKVINIPDIKKWGVLEDIVWVFINVFIQLNIV